MSSRDLFLRFFVGLSLIISTLVPYFSAGFQVKFPFRAYVDVESDLYSPLFASFIMFRSIRARVSATFSQSPPALSVWSQKQTGSSGTYLVHIRDLRCERNVVVRKQPNSLLCHVMWSTCRSCTFYFDNKLYGWQETSGFHTQVRTSRPEKTASFDQSSSTSRSSGPVVEWCSLKSVRCRSPERLQLTCSGRSWFRSEQLIKPPKSNRLKFLRQVGNLFSWHQTPLNHPTYYISAISFFHQIFVDLLSEKWNNLCNHVPNCQPC